MSQGVNNEQAPNQSFYPSVNLNNSRMMLDDIQSSRFGKENTQTNGTSHGLQQSRVSLG